MVLDELYELEPYGLVYAKKKKLRSWVNDLTKKHIMAVPSTDESDTFIYMWTNVRQVLRYRSFRSFV